MMSSPFLGSVLLVAGTAIGAGMLALPLTAGLGGFGPGMVIIVVCYAYMMLTLFGLLEANLYCAQADANIISMAGERLGRWAQVVAWCCFLLLLYAASAAYMAAGGGLLTSVHPALHHHTTTGMLMFAALFGVVAYWGLSWIDRLNRLLMVGLGLTYVLLIGSVVPHINPQHWAFVDTRFVWAAVPVVILSFTSHIVLPSLRAYLQDDVRTLRRVFWIGGSVPLVFYTLWQASLVGLLPARGLDSLYTISASASPMRSLYHVLSDMHLGWVALNNNFFSFFALVTSFLGVMVSLKDFLADGLGLGDTPRERLLLLLMTLAPPLLFALFFRSGFLLALSYGGVFIAVLYGLLPALMLWKARYREHRPAPAYTLPGGKAALVLMFVGGLVVIGLQVADTQGWLPKPTPSVLEGHRG